MGRFGKPDATGRSSGRPYRRERKLLYPPPGESWVWLTLDLLASEAWNGMTINCRRFVDFLLIEHRNHAGRANGRLCATYDQLEQAGIQRERILNAIEEAIERGLIERTVKGGLFGSPVKRTASRYRLTWYGCIEPEREATNEWMRYRKKTVSRYPPGTAVAVGKGEAGGG